MAAHSFLVAWKDERVRSLLTAVVWEVESIEKVPWHTPRTAHTQPVSERRNIIREENSQVSGKLEKSEKVGLKLQWTKNNWKLSFIICKMSLDIFYSYRRNSFQGMEIPCSKNQIGWQRNREMENILGQSRLIGIEMGEGVRRTGGRDFHQVYIASRKKSTSWETDCKFRKTVSQGWEGLLLSLELVKTNAKPQYTKGWINIPVSTPSTPLGFAEHLKMLNSFYTLGYLPPASPVLLLNQTQQLGCYITK